MTDKIEQVYDTLVELCPSVDYCPKKCLKADREKCYGIVAKHVAAIFQTEPVTQPAEFNPDYLRFKDGVAATERVWQEKIDRLFEEIENLTLMILRSDATGGTFYPFEDTSEFQALKAKYGGK